MPSGTNPANTTLWGLGGTATTNTGLLKDFNTGVDLAATVTVVNGGATLNGTGGPMPDAGTDAYNIFNGKVDIANALIYYGGTGWYVDLVFTGLEPTLTYTLATTLNRGSYTDRWSKITISDADVFTYASSAGAYKVNDSTVSIVSGNTTNGYVAQWTNILPGSDGDFTIRFTYASGPADIPAGASQNGVTAYGPAGFMLQETGSLPTLTWDGTAVADWNSANWLGSPPTFPNATTVAAIAGGAGGTLITVTDDNAAYKLDMTGAVGGKPNLLTIAPSKSLTVASRIDASGLFNYVMLDEGARLSTGSSKSNLWAFWWTGNATVVTPGDLTVGFSLSDETDPGAPLRTLTKRGAGTFSFDNTASGMTTTNTVFRIEEGTLDVLGNVPLGDTPLSGEKRIELAGGKLRVSPAPVIAQGLWYGQLPGDINVTDPNPKSYITTDLRETENAIGATTTEVYTGLYYTGAGGTQSFMEDMDDRARLWVNNQLILNNDAWDVETTNAIVLPAGQWVPFELRISNGGNPGGPTAGSEPGFAYDPTGGTSWLHPWPDAINAGDGDPNLFGYLDPQPFHLPTVNVVVDAAGSILDVNNAAATDFGKLTLQTGVLTIKSPGAVSFGQTVIPSGITGTVGVDAQTAGIDLGVIRANGNTVTLSKRGAPDLALNSGNTGLTSDVILDAAGGRMISVGLAPVGSAALQLNGGDIALSSTGGDLAVNNVVKVLSSNSVLSAGKFLTGVAGPVNVTLNNLAVGDVVMKLNATDNYRFVIPGALSLPGGGLAIMAGRTEVKGLIDVNRLEIYGQLTRSGATPAQRAVNVKQALILSGDSLDMSADPFTLTTDTEVIIGDGQNLKMVGPFSAGTLDLTGTLTLVGDQGITVKNYLKILGADLNMTGRPLNVTTAVVQIGQDRKLTFDPAGGLVAGGLDLVSGSQLNLTGANKNITLDKLLSVKQTTGPSHFN